MRGRLIRILAIAVMAAILCPAHALAADSVDKARDFMKARMFEQAVEILSKEITANPVNADAHFELGVCYVNSHDFLSAEERFESAVALKPAYSDKIGSVYRDAARYSLQKSRYAEADGLYAKAVEYQPGLSFEACEAFYSAVAKSSDADAYDIYIMAREYCGDKHDREMGQRLLTAARSRPTEKRREWLEKAAKFMPWTEISKEFPEPRWVSVFLQEYEGRGNRYVKTVLYGTDALAGDHVILNSDAEYMVYEGKWTTQTGRREFVVDASVDGQYLYIGAPEGAKVRLEVKRLQKYY